MKDYIQIGIDKGLISLNEDRSRTETTRHIYDLCQRAKTLQEEGKRVLDEAKQEVERMILSGRILGMSMKEQK